MTAKPKKLSIHSIVILILILLYPVIAYLGIKSLGVRLASIVVLALLVGSTAARIAATRSLLLPLLLQAGAVAAILGAGYLLRDSLYMKLVPALIASSASLNFFLSLLRTPVIESFARMKKPDLSPPEVRYTRGVTHLWGWTMAADAVLCLAAAATGSLRLWLILCFPVSYALIGLVFCSEYVVRKRRFDDFDEALIWDRVLKAVMGK
jgi:uncharacterized membrane protein